MERDSALSAATAIGQFNIVRMLGRGGFGITYEAWDSSLNRPVAIKEYFPHAWASRAADGITVSCLVQEEPAYRKGLDRFLDEARTLAQFHDPRIVRVNGFQEANNTAYMVMDLERGHLLRDVVQQNGPLSPVDAREVLIDILKALQIVHEHRFLHRDIKPSNLMRRPSGQIVLLDFGSARLSGAAASKAFTVMVTPGYAPIEQYDADLVQGPSADLYAVGASMLFCLTGRAPPDGFKRAVALQSSETDPIEPLLARLPVGEPVSLELAETIRWLMQPMAASRPQDARSVLEQLSSGEATMIPATITLAGMRTIPGRLVEPMRMHLESLIGGRSTSVLLSATRSARNAHDFIERIASQITDIDQAGQARDGLRRILAGTMPVSAAAAAKAVPVVAAPSGIMCDDATTNLLTSELAKYIGPIAGMLVKKGLAKAASRAELISQLEAEIAEQADRDAFRRAIQRVSSFAV